MKTHIYSYLITTLAGFSTLLGVIPCFIKSNNKEKIITSSLSFSAGVMLTISLTSLIPESLNLFSSKLKLFPTIIILSIFITTGIIFSMTLDQKIERIITNNKLYKLGIISVFALILHNIPEGITTFISSSIDLKLGLILAISIALHNIPEGISIAVPIYHSTNKIRKALIYTFISGFSELFGAILAHLFLRKYINNLILGIILALTSGIMIHIAIYELLPNAFSYKKNKVALISLFLGIITMLLCTILL